MKAVTIVIPVFHDDRALARTLATTDFSGCELIVASTSDDRACLEPLRSRWPDVTWVETTRGRAHQMNAAAEAAHGDWILFLHADTLLPLQWREAIEAADRDPRAVIGCFRFALDSRALAARAIEAGVRARVRVLSLPYGDQALFVRRRVFQMIGGYAEIPIMEDVDLVLRMRAHGTLFRSAMAARTSARKWERDGWLRRTAGNLYLMARYLTGTSPKRLYHLYNNDHAHQTPGRHPQL
jgi:rSAM/selenodomain-associated transferase 2